MHIKAILGVSAVAVGAMLYFVVYPFDKALEAVASRMNTQDYLGD